MFVSIFTSRCQGYKRVIKVIQSFRLYCAKLSMYSACSPCLHCGLHCGFTVCVCVAKVLKIAVYGSVMSNTHE